MHSPALHQAAQPQASHGARPAVRLRLAGAALAAACASVLALAWWLSPSPAGYGTHEQLGMLPCSFLVKTGYPCPSCGMTTAVAAAVHGRVMESLRAQPFGVVLAGFLALLAAAGAAQALTGRAALAALRVRWWWFLAALGGMLAGWAIVVGMGLAASRLPIR